MAAMSPPADSQPGRSKRVVGALIRATMLVLLLVVIPGVVGLVTAGSRGSVALTVGSLFSFVAARTLGWRLVRNRVAVLALAFVVGAITAGTWSAVLAAALAGAVAGFSARWGTVPIYGLTMLVVTTAQPFISSAGATVANVGEAALAFLMVCIGGLFGTELARRTGAEEQTPQPPFANDRAIRLSVAFALAMAIATGIAVASGLPRAYWIPMTVAVVALPTAEGTLARGRDRLTGTIIGLVALVPLALVHPPRTVTLAVAAVMLVLVIATPRPYWLQTTFTTVMILLLVAPESTVQIAGERLMETLAGLAVLAAVGGAMVWWNRKARPALSGTSS